MRAGRRIFANLQRAMGYLFAVHVPIVGLSLFPLLGGPVLLLPIHVVLLELIIDPACSLVFEAEPPRRAEDAGAAAERDDAAVQRRGGRARRSASVARRLLAVVVVQWAGRAAALPDEALRLAGLATIVVGNLAMLQWFRGGFGRKARPTAPSRGSCWRRASWEATVLLLAPLRAAFGLPLTIDIASVLVLLGAPAAWAVWRLFRSSTGGRSNSTSMRAR